MWASVYRFAFKSDRTLIRVVVNSVSSLTVIPMRENERQRGREREKEVTIKKMPRTTPMEIQPGDKKEGRARRYT